MQISRKRLVKAVAFSAAFVFAGSAFAELSEEQIAKLGTELTPIGANPEGNEAGTIPPWTGGLTSPPEGWTPEQGYIDPFPEDQVLYTITRDNLDEYRDSLSAGQIALLQKYDNFKMPVYQTRRTAALPQAVYDKVKAEAGNVELNGFGIRNLNGSKVPFPIPENGLEAIWNHIVRYLGGGVERNYHWFPVRSNGDYYKVGFLEKRIFDENMDRRTDNRLVNYVAEFTAPPTLEGTIQLVHDPIDQVKEKRAAWIYNVGQRRVRRAPDLAYDNANDGTEGIRTTDQFDAYNGAPDRYNWELKGKKEIYVPYNTYKLSDKSLSYDDILQENTINADFMRYELHRVWVVEATLREDSSHIYGKRTFYLDEDSWSVVMEDAYDTRGDLWRVSLHGMVQFYDAMVPWYRFNLFHDLNNGSYLVSNLSNEIDDKPWEFNVEGRYIDFQPDALRRRGR